MDDNSIGFQVAVSVSSGTLAVPSIRSLWSQEKLVNEIEHLVASGHIECARLHSRSESPCAVERLTYQLVCSVLDCKGIHG